MSKTIYLDLEDDITKISARIAKETASELVLVFPKRSSLFADSINLRLLKKQVELLGKDVSILTMDEIGQMYAKEAGFSLKFLPNRSRGAKFSDIRPRQQEETPLRKPLQPKPLHREPVRRKPVHRPIVADTTIEDSGQGANDNIFALPPINVEPVTTMDGVTSPEALRDDFFYQPANTASAHVIKQGKPGKRYRKYVIAFVAAALAIITLFVLVVLPSATIIVHAKTQTVSRDVELSAATAIKDVDSVKLALPATAVQKTLDVTSKLTSTGKREVGSKAQGTVLIYNLSKKTLNLKAATTTLQVGGKQYVFTEDQSSIKSVGANAPESDLRSAQIIAVNGGEDFNLPAGTRIEINNQVFGSQPDVLYAVAKTQVGGGTSRFISLVSDEDYKKAEEALKTKALEQIRGELKQQNLTLLDNAFAPMELSEFAADKPVGTEAPQFEAKAKVKVTGLAFEEKQLIELIRQRISATFPQGKKLQDSSEDKMTMKVRNQADVTNGILGLSVHYESAASFDLDIGDVRPKIAGKTKEEASEFLLSRPEVDRVDITLSPAWQNKIPRFTAKVKVEVKK